MPPKGGMAFFFGCALPVARTEWFKSPSPPIDPGSAFSVTGAFLPQQKAASRFNPGSTFSVVGAFLPQQKAASRFNPSSAFSVIGAFLPQEKSSIPVEPRFRIFGNWGILAPSKSGIHVESLSGKVSTHLPPHSATMPPKPAPSGASHAAPSSRR